MIIECIILHQNKLSRCRYKKKPVIYVTGKYMCTGKPTLMIFFFSQLQMLTIEQHFQLIEILLHYTTCTNGEQFFFLLFPC